MMILEVLGDSSWSNTSWDVLDYRFVPQFRVKHQTEILQNSALPTHHLLSIVFNQLERIVTWVRQQLLACTHPFLANAAQWLILLYRKPDCFQISGSNKELFTNLCCLFDKLSTTPAISAISFQRFRRCSGGWSILMPLMTKLHPR